MTNDIAIDESVFDSVLLNISTSLLKCYSNQKKKIKEFSYFARQNMKDITNQVQERIKELSFLPSVSSYGVYSNVLIAYWDKYKGQ
jgi:hypothetical protein